MRRPLHFMVFVLVVSLLGMTAAVEAISLSRGTPATASSDPTSISISPHAGYWTAVGVSSDSDWDISLGASSTYGGDDCDFVVANGNLGSVSPTSGSVSRYSGAASAIVQHADDGLIGSGGGTSTYAWGSNDVIYLWEISITSTGTRNVTVDANMSSTYLHWWLYAPGANSSWKARNAYTYGGSSGYYTGMTPQSINFNQTGYWCLVLVCDGGGGISTTMTVTVGAGGSPPSTPTGLDVSNPTSTTLDIDWNASAGATSYTLQRSTSAYGTYSTVYSGANTSYTDTGLSPSTSYYYKVRASNAAGDSAYSYYDYGTTTALSLSLSRGVSQTTTTNPTNFDLSIHANYWNAVAVSSTNDWDLNIGGTYSSYGSGADFVAANGNNGTITPTSGQVTYGSGTAYVEQADDDSVSGGGGTSSMTWSSTDIINLWECYVSTTGTMSITVDGTGSISDFKWFVFNPGYNASWRSRSYATYGGSSGYQVGASAQMINLNATGYWCIVVVKNNGAGVSSTITVTVASPTPATPTGLAVSNPTTSSLDLDWDSVAGATSYTVQRASAAGGPWTTVSTAYTNSYTDYFLSAGTTYYYQVRANNAYGNSAYCTPESGTTLPTAPSTPTGLNVSNPTASTLDISWNASAGATSYTLQRSTSAYGTYSTVYDGPNTSFTDTGLAPGTTYYYKVRASNGGGDSYFSSYASGTTTVASNPDIYEPDDSSGQATDLGASSTTSANHSIDPVDDEDWYSFTVTGTASVELETSGAAGGDTQMWLYNAGLGQIDFDDDDGTGTYSLIQQPSLTAGTYYVKVDEYGNNDIISSYQLQLTITVPPPGTPLGLTVTPSGNDTLVVSWNSVAGATSYTLQRGSTPTGPWTTVYTGPNTSYSDSGLPVGTTYYYHVRASNAAGDSLYSAAVSGTTGGGATPPPTPTGLLATPSGAADIQVSWSASAGATGYTVQRSTSAGGPWTTVYTGPNTSYLDTGLAAGTTYYYQVRASNAAGDSAYSAATSAMAGGNPGAPPTPAGLSVTGTTSDSISLAWNPSTGATSYRLEQGSSATGPWQIVYDGPNTAYTDQPLAAGTDYWYQVRASNANGDSAYSAPVQGTTQVSGGPTLAGLPGNQTLQIGNTFTLTGTVTSLGTLSNVNIIVELPGGGLDSTTYLYTGLSTATFDLGAVVFDPANHGNATGLYTLHVWATDTMVPTPTAPLGSFTIDVTGIPTLNDFGVTMLLPYEGTKTIVQYETTGGGTHTAHPQDQLAVDFAVAVGDVVLAPCDLTVIGVGLDPAHEYGRYVVAQVMGTQGLLCLFANLDAFGPLTQVGRIFTTGDRIGLAGMSGAGVSQPQLLFRVWNNPQGAAAWYPSQLYLGNAVRIQAIDGYAALSQGLAALSSNVENGSTVGNMTANFTQEISGLLVSFLDASLGPIASWTWDFGDGNTTTERNPVHVFPDTGDYRVVLTVSDGAFQATYTVWVSVTKPVLTGNKKSSSCAMLPAGNSADACWLLLALLTLLTVSLRRRRAA